MSTRHRRSPTMYQVPATRRSVVQFVMTCPGMSHSSTFTLHMRDNGEVNDGKVWGDFCREKVVNIAYQAHPGWFEVDNVTGEMVRYPPNPVSGNEYIPYYWEMLETFFKNHAIVPVWTPCQSYGVYDEELEIWTEQVGEVSKAFYEKIHIKLHCITFHSQDSKR